MSRKLRVCFLIDSITSPTAGSERQLLMLLEGLDRAEFEPRLCVLQGSGWLEREFTACPVRVLGISSFKSLSALGSIIRFSRWLRSEKIDILQVHFRDSSIVGILAALLAPKVAVLAARKNQGYWMRRGDMLLTRILNLGVDMFVANSEDTRRWVMRAEKVPGGKIRVVPNGIDCPEADMDGGEARRSAREALGVAEDAPLVGAVSNLRPVKRVDVFVKAAALVRERMPETVFAVAGEGEERGRIEALARELGLDGSLRLLGRRLDVSALLPAFDVGVLTSDSESFSNSLLEFMAAGLPVVTTDVGGCREALGDSEGGVIVPVGDSREVARAVLMLLGSQRRRQWARASHPARVRELFSRQAYVGGYAALYRAASLEKGFGS